VEIRPYAAGDAGVLVDLFRDTVRSVNLADYNADQVRAWAPDAIDADAWADRLAGNHSFVAEVGGAVAGFTELTGECHVHMLFVAKDRQRQGVASALLERVEAEARDLGLDRLTTEASLTARPVFERYGFAVVARQEVAIRNQRLTNFRMTKRLLP
jgi:GNAT superfamily N-acetyltransferase